jgi:hypothetical protein
LLELNAVKQPLNIARDRIRGHDERGIKRMNVFACYRAFSMTDKRRDSYLSEAKISILR